VGTQRIRLKTPDDEVPLMSNPVVSVILTTYYRNEMLRDAIESVHR
jgi:hypothetical protein